MLSFRSRCLLSTLSQNAVEAKNLACIQNVRHNSYYKKESIDSSVGKPLIFNLPEMDISPALYGGKSTVTMIHGDGVGPEIMEHVKRSFKLLRAPVSFDELNIKEDAEIAKFAFEYARTHRRKKVTAVHKANIMKLGDGLFLQCCDEVAQQYPDIEFNTIIVDNCCMQLVSRPQQFDVMVLPNLYGNIVGNVLAGLVGGAGLTAGTNVGQKYAVFESGTRNSGKTLVGKNLANPIALLLSSTNMLEYMGHRDKGRLLRMAVYNATGNLGLKTADLGGNTTTTEMMDAIYGYIDENLE